MIEVSSLLAAPPERVWERVSTPEGVNDEFRPFLRMTFPGWVSSLDAASVPVGERLFRSWILLFGVLPVDWDDLTLVRVEPGRGFLERSSLASQRLWEHERAIEPAGEGARLVDRLRWEPRPPLPAAAFRPLYRAVFAWRHLRLRRFFGVPPVIVLYDRDCGLCRWSMGKLLAWDRHGLVRPLPLDSPEGIRLTPGMSDAERARSAHAVTADGEVASGGRLLRLVGPVLPGGAPLAALARRFPRATERAYRAVADRRDALGRLVTDGARRRAGERLATRP